MYKAYDIKDFNSYKLNDVDFVSDTVDKYFNSLMYKVKATQKDEFGEVTDILNADGEPLYKFEFVTPPTIVGLSNALGVSKTTLDNYRKGKDRDIPSCELLSNQIKECEYAIKNKKQKLSFVDILPSKAYLKELNEALILRQVINIIDYAYSIIEEYNTISIYDKDKFRGASFSLKNSFGYSEKSEIELKETKKFEDFMKE